MDASFWDVLGIAETTDERAIKRAYAARLRITSPESDAAGYMKLRDAYEAAKRHATFQRLCESPDEIPPVEKPETIDVPTALSPRQQAFANLQALLSEHKLEDFLREIDAVQDSQTFATLDEQYDFIGEVALLVKRAKVEDVAWLGRLASMLGAREHDNIFSRDSGYWFAYESLLESYAELRESDARDHGYDHDEVATTPGYLHVYNVLTAPFDAERLSALTRSRIYHRLAEKVLERSKSDPAIVIPADNREWWERTSMAGQHRPSEEPAAVPVTAAPAEQSSEFPFWTLWVAVVLLLNGLRSCVNY